MFTKRLMIARLVTTLLFTYAIANLSSQNHWAQTHMTSFQGEMISRIIP